MSVALAGYRGGTGGKARQGGRGATPVVDREVDGPGVGGTTTSEGRVVARGRPRGCLERRYDERKSERAKANAPQPVSPSGSRGCWLETCLRWAQRGSMANTEARFRPPVTRFVSWRTIARIGSREVR